MGSQLRWLERMPDKHEVDGSIPFEPTKVANYKQAVQGNQEKIFEIILIVYRKNFYED